MYIRSLFVESFAGMKDREICFEEGLNVIEGTNESGKSTICMFIKFMFYGLSGRGSDGEMSERQKYVPWDTGRAAGTLTVSTAKGDFRISRSLLVSDGETPRERLEIIDLSSGEKVFKGKVPGLCILGMDEQMFVNTVFVRQVGSTAIDTTGMSEAIENILLSGDETVSMKKALDRLEKARKALMHKRGSGGALQSAINDSSRIERELAEARKGNSDMIELEGESEKLSALIAKRTAEKEENEALYEAFVKLENAKRTDEGLLLKKKTEKLEAELSALERYGNVSEKAGKINALYTAFSSADTRLKALQEGLSEEPDRTLRRTEEEILKARNEVSLAKSLKGKKNLFLGLFAAFVCLGGAFAGLSLVMSEALFMLLLYLGGGLAALSAVFCILFAVNSLSFSKILKKWGVRSISSLESEVEAVISRAYAYDKAVDDRSRTLVSIGECEEERRRALALLRTLCLEFCDEDNDDAKALYETSLRKAFDISKKREELNRELGVANGELSSFRDVLASDGGRAVLRAREEVLLTNAGKTASLMDKKAAKLCFEKKNFAQSVLPGLLKRKGELDSSLAKLKATTKDTAILSAQLDLVRRDIEDMKKRLMGIEEASRALNTAGEGLRRSLVPRVLSEAEKLLSDFTYGKYNSLSASADREFDMSFKIDGVNRDIYCMSAGTADAAYISIRCALASVLFPGDSLPLIYDESFARVDEERLSRMISMLEKSGMQSLLFTCRSLEANLTAKNHIRL